MILVGSDHAGYPLKCAIVQYLKTKGLEYDDAGTFEGEAGDYPQYAFLVAEAVARGDANRGILFCGTGIGMAIAANKVQGIRCVVCSEPYSALLSRQHNDSNILSLGSRVVGHDLAVMIVETWLNGQFEGGRHQRRVDAIDGYIRQ